LNGMASGTNDVGRGATVLCTLPESRDPMTVIGMHLRNGLVGDAAFRRIADAMPEAIYTTDADGRITYYNQAAAALWGRHPKIGEDWWCGSWKLFWPDGRPMAHDECPMAEALKTGVPVRGKEAVAERPNGTRFPFIPHPTPIHDEDGVLAGAVNILLDISDRKRHEALSQHLAAIVTSSRDAIVSKDLHGIVTSWNREAEQLFGYPEAEMIGRSILAIIPPDRRDEEDRIIAAIRRGERVEHFETQRRHKDGSLIDVSLTISPICRADGTVVGASKIARDISESKRARQTTELLLAELRHRVKNTLAMVQAIAAQTFRDTPAEERDCFAARVRALAEAHNLLTHKSAGGVGMNEVVERALRPFRGNTRTRILVSGPEAYLPPNKALMLAMALHELGTNAVKYGALSAEAGRVDVQWDLAGHGNNRLHLSWQECGGPPVVPPTRTGFGSRMLERAFRSEGAQAGISYLPEGIACSIELAICGSPH